MHPAFSENKNQTSTAIYPVSMLSLENWVRQQPRHVQQWVKTSQFKAEPGKFCLIPNHDGSLNCVLLGLENEMDWWAFGALPAVLPEGLFHIEETELLKNATQHQLAALAWGLGFYQFSNYKKSLPRLAKLILNESVDEAFLTQQLDSIYLSRDLINSSRVFA